MNKRIYAFSLVALTACAAMAQTAVVDTKALRPQTMSPQAVALGDANFNTKVAAEAVAPVASVSAPLSVLPVGLSLDYSRLVQGGQPLVMGLAPYQTPLTWAGYGQGDFRTYSWSYPDPADKNNMLASSSQNLEAPAYPYGQFAAPTLTLGGGELASEPANAYAVVQYGGIPVAKVNGQNTVFEPSLYNYGRYVGGYVTFNVYGNGLSGVGEKAEATWKSEDYGSGKYIDKVLGVGVAVPPPAAPYQVSYAYARFTASTLTDKSKLTVKVYSATADMKLLATGETKRSQTYQSSADSWATAVFALTPVDGEAGEPLLVDGPVLFVFGGDMASGENIEYGMARDLDGYDEGQSCRGYFVFKDSSDNFRLLRTNQIPFPDGSSSTGVFASFDATYSWLKCDDTAFDAPAAGGEKTFEIDAYYNLADAAVTKVTANTAADWVKVSAGQMDDATGLSPMKVTVEALPDGTASRSVELTLNTNGLKQKFTITQGSGAVADLTASQTKAYFNGGVLTVESQTATSVEVYNVAGQKMADAAVEGRAEIQGLEKGVYVLKFNDNTVVKVAR